MTTTSAEIQKLEAEIGALSRKLGQLRKDTAPQRVKNYKFQDLNGEHTLLDLFAGKEQLLAIHNMGQGCRYCTLWADGMNGFLPHLENEFSVVLFSKDSPTLQRQFANSRGWHFRMFSHGGGEYIQEQSVMTGERNGPGLVCYFRKGDEIFRKNASAFGPGDQFCSLWHIISLAGRNEENWTPQYNYWKPMAPAQMDDGGKNVI